MRLALVPGRNRFGDPHAKAQLDRRGSSPYGIDDAETRWALVRHRTPWLPVLAVVAVAFAAVGVDHAATVEGQVRRA